MSYFLGLALGSFFTFILYGLWLESDIDPHYETEFEPRPYDWDIEDEDLWR